ncbi:MAG: DUF5615 family PIN-like protein [Phycisphaerales bacterium]
MDQGMPRGAVEELRRLGHDVCHVADVEMTRSSDAEIVVFARSSNAVIVTLDADFHAIMATSGERIPSVVRLRLEGVRSAGLAAILVEVVAKLGRELESGALVTVDARTIRFRLLPISG